MDLSPLQRLLPQTATRAIAAVTPERVHIRPHPGLRGAISHYTVYAPKPVTSSSRTPETISIVPDASGCIVCLVTERSLETRFWGPSSRVVTVANNPQALSLYLMVEFLPCGANRLLDISMSSLHNAVLPLETVDACLARSIAGDFEIFCAGGFSAGLGAFLGALDRLFLQRLERTEDSAVSRHVVGMLTRAAGALPVAELSGRVGYSPRHLNRVMAETLGMNVKLLGRILRVNAACRWMEAAPVVLTDLAHRLGYHDQSHFIHDFAGVCGISPGLYVRRMSDFYNEDLKLGVTVPER